MIKVGQVTAAGDYGVAVRGNGGEEQLTILLSSGQDGKTALHVVATSVDHGVWRLHDGLVPTPQVRAKLAEVIPTWTRGHGKVEGADRILTEMQRFGFFLDQVPEPTKPAPGGSHGHLTIEVGQRFRVHGDPDGNIYALRGIDTSRHRIWLAMERDDYDGYDGDLILDLVADDAGSPAWTVVLADERCSWYGQEVNLEPVPGAEPAGKPIGVSCCGATFATAAQAEDHERWHRVQRS
jgi:hypothetical protein